MNNNWIIFILDVINFNKLLLTVLFAKKLGFFTEKNIFQILSILIVWYTKHHTCMYYVKKPFGPKEVNKRSPLTSSSTICNTRYVTGNKKKPFIHFCPLFVTNNMTENRAISVLISCHSPRWKITLDFWVSYSDECFVGSVKSVGYT